MEMALISGSPMHLRGFTEENGKTVSSRATGDIGVEIQDEARWELENTGQREEVETDWDLVKKVFDLRERRAQLEAANPRARRGDTWYDDRWGWN